MLRALFPERDVNIVTPKLPRQVPENAQLCDDVKAAVVAAERKGKAVFELEIDAYSW
jgi:hypothetical protein